MADSFEPYYPHTVLQLELPEAASQTFVRGNLLILDGNGRIAEAGADPASIYGVAAKDGANNASAGAATSEVYVITPGSVWVAKSSGTTALAHQGAQYGVVLTSDVWYVDITDTTNKAVSILKLDPRDAVGTSNGRYILMFSYDHIQGSQS